MSSYVKWTLIGIATECVAFLSFIFVARTPWGSWGKFVCIVIFFCSTLAFLGYVARSMEPKELIRMGAHIGAGVVIFIQIVGFSFFPGIIKDATFLSLFHLELIGIQFFSLFAFNSIVALIAWALFKNK